MISRTASIEETKMDHLFWGSDGAHVAGGGSRESEIHKRSDVLNFWCLYRL